MRKSNVPDFEIFQECVFLYEKKGNKRYENRKGSKKQQQKKEERIDKRKSQNKLVYDPEI